MLDATTSTNWDVSPVNGQTYSLDSFSVTKNNADTTFANLFVGVYTGYTAAADSNSSGTFTGYLGSSSNSIAWGAAASGTSLTWNFSGVNALASDGADYFFAFQETNANTYTPPTTTGPTPTAIPEGSIAVQRLGTGDIALDRAGIAQINSNFRGDRVPITTIGITAVPEPSSSLLIGLAAIAGLGFRRRLA